MTDKRKLSRDEVDAATDLDVRIPEYDGASHPFSRGQFPEIYTPEGLKKVAEQDSSRTDWFLKRLCTMHEIIGAPVPFYFRDWAGNLRSLDAGCLGFLVNGSEPRLKLNLGTENFISTVEPTKKGVELSTPMIERLRAEMTPPQE